MKMSFSVLIVLTIAATALVESSPGPGYINRVPSSRPRFERSANPDPQGFGGFGRRFSNVGGYDFSYHPPAPSYGGSGSFYQPAPRPTFNFPERPSPNSFVSNPMGGGVNLGFNRRIIDNDRGTLDGTAAVLAIPNGSGLIKLPNVGLQGTYHPTPQGTVSVNANKFVDGAVDQRPSGGVGYEHTILQGKDGKVTVSAGVQKTPGQSPTGTVGIGATFR